MLGQRLRMARLAAGLTLDGLAARLDRPITKQALSKYERGVSEPPLSRIEELAAVLNVNVSTLLEESAIEIRWVAYRKLARLSRSRQERITAAAAQRLEGEIRLRALFHLGERLNLPGPIDVQRLGDCDYAAATLRMRWNLGDRPVDSLIELIEDHGTAVLARYEEWGFDGLSGWANQTPVIVLNAAVPKDRLRLNAAHEVGHLVMKSTGDAQQDEQFAFRFAASFLVPGEAARQELGTHRRSLNMEELGLLKQRWGISMQAWIRRARDLEVISDDLYGRLNLQFRHAGWHRHEPFGYEGNESPGLFPRLVLRALSERMISFEEARQLHPGLSVDMGEVSMEQTTSTANAGRRGTGQLETEQ